MMNIMMTDCIDCDACVSCITCNMCGCRVKLYDKNGPKIFQKYRRRFSKKEIVEHLEEAGLKG